MKILLAKPGLDGHDVGVKVLAHALKEAGFEVVYTGLRKSIEEIVSKATEAKADIIGLSILSGTHKVLCLKMSEVMEKSDVKIPWVVGGNIPSQDVEAIERTGANKAFATGTQIEAVVDYVRSMEKVINE